MLLDIIIDSTLFLIICAGLLIMIIFLFFSISENKNSIHKLELDNLKKEGVINEQNVEIQKTQAEMKAQAQDNAVIMFEEWKQNELIKYMKVIEDAGIEKAQALLNQWKVNEEERIRKDAANRSVRNVLGKVTEHLIPFSEAMKHFNPKDIRFIGSPIDLIVFDGAEELKDEISIYFIEVKTGTSALSKGKD